MGRYLELAREALADLKHGTAKPLQTLSSPEGPYDINDQNDRRVSGSDLPPRADSTNLDVQLARQEAQALGVRGRSPRGFDWGPQWVTGDALNRLPEPLQGLVCPREGWTPQAWAGYLWYRTAICDERHQDLAVMYGQAAELLESRKRGNRP